MAVFLTEERERFAEDPLFGKYIAALHKNFQFHVPQIVALDMDQTIVGFGKIHALVGALTLEKLGFIAKDQIKDVAEKYATLKINAGVSAYYGWIQDVLKEGDGVQKLVDMLGEKYKIELNEGELLLLSAIKGKLISSQYLPDEEFYGMFEKSNSNDFLQHKLFVPYHETERSDFINTLARKQLIPVDIFNKFVQFLNAYDIPVIILTNREYADAKEILQKHIFEPDVHYDFTPNIIVGRGGGKKLEAKPNSALMVEGLNRLKSWFNSRNLPSDDISKFRIHMIGDSTTDRRKFANNCHQDGIENIDTIAVFEPDSHVLMPNGSINHDSHFFGAITEPDAIASFHTFFDYAVTVSQRIVEGLGERFTKASFDNSRIVSSSSLFSDIIVAYSNFHPTEWQFELEKLLAPG